MNELYLYPACSNSDKNKYLHRLSECFVSLGFDVLPWKVALKSFKFRSGICVISWLEDNVGFLDVNPWVAFVKCIIILSALKIKTKKMIWVRHNLKPHDLVRATKLYNTLVKILTAVSDVVVTHAENDRVHNSTIIPHHLYSGEKPADTIRDIDMLYFGVIKKYKGIDRLLGEWPSDKKLILLGRCDDADLKKRINAAIVERDLDVEWRNEFVSDDELNDHISRSKFVILPHLDETMIVSGAFYHAISFGANIILRDGAFARTCQQRHPFVSVYKPGELQDVIKSIDYVDPHVVMKIASEQYGEEACRAAWSRILGQP
ncbi:hypothetical protein [Pseudodesulfovibrio methanolicus]|uniref:Glycosyltransferase n=1 Tax=Pseudodesulfovibrio methanolicus TaxID=3126690 RepID=A0ABZ2ITK6_9BACT